MKATSILIIILALATVGASATGGEWNVYLDSSAINRITREGNHLLCATSGGILRFDLAELPRTAKVTRASLWLYDASKIRGEVELRVGREGESYPGIRKDDVHLSGRPVLVDEEGPFGNPTSDSLRTSVNGSTRSLWMVIFSPAGTAPSEMERHVEIARRSMAAHLAPPGAAVKTSGGIFPSTG